MKFLKTFLAFVAYVASQDNTTSYSTLPKEESYEKWKAKVAANDFDEEDFEVFMKELKLRAMNMA